MMNATELQHEIDLVLDIISIYKNVQTFNEDSQKLQVGGLLKLSCLNYINYNKEVLWDKEFILSALDQDLITLQYKGLPQTYKIDNLLSKETHQALGNVLDYAGNIFITMNISCTEETSIGVCTLKDLLDIIYI